ncbi:MAG: hypothetical protein M1831_005650 [Alyxoria varia]|nr:MAG: hypothetical protein M1831_005650 [Alyxoria varia]
MLPLVGDLAPPHRRATAVSIVVSGNVLGILIARILSGVVTQYTAWRNIYWLALGLQFFIFSLLWLFMPDYPSTNPGGINYFKMLWSVVTMGKKHAVLVQASLVSFCTSACFTSFWTTLTFLLSGPPYHYSTLVIGLFALIGIAAIALGPFYAKLFIDSFVPNVSTLIGLFIYMLGACIGAYTGKVTVAGPIIQALALDAGLQITQIANRSAIYAVEPHGRNRINTFFMLFTFIGQLTGTAAGNRLYVKSGWVATGSLNVALIAFAMLLVAVRGPYEQGWFGWRGGWTIKKRNRQTADGKTEEKSLGLARGDDKPVDIVPQDDEEKQSAQDARVLAPTQTSGARGSLNDGR